MKQISALLARLLRLPIALLQFLVGLLVAIVARVLAPVLSQVDESRQLSGRINALSSSMATQRGLLLMIGTGIVLTSLVVHALTVMIMVATHSFDRHLYWLCIPSGMLHIGVLFGFIGIMLAVPLGQGYKSQRE